MTEETMNLICIKCNWKGVEKVADPIEVCPSCGLADELCDDDMDDHIMCQSYPNCEDAPDGCDIATGMSFIDRWGM